MTHALALFVHVASAMALFAALGIEGSSLLHARRAPDAGGVEAALRGMRWVQRVGGPAMGGTVLAGLYLAGTAWGWRQAWIDVALAGFVLLGAVGGTMTGARVARLQRNKDAGGLRDPVLWWSFTIRLGVLVGIVFLMTVKPGWAGSLTALTAAAAAGLFSGIPRSRPEPAVS
jgi:uncharacterized membrane protein